MVQSLCITCTNEQRAYIKEHHVSPSLIFQSRVNELMGLSPACSLAELTNLQEKVQILVKRLTKMCNYMEKRGVLDEFLEKERKADEE